MALKATISKDDFDNLDAVLQEHYTESGDNYILDAEGVEDVTGLKAKRDELLAELKKTKSLYSQFEGLDPDEAKTALEKLKDIEKKKLASKGQYDELLNQYKTDFEQKLEKETAEKTQILQNLKRQTLTNYLVEKGVKADRAKYALVEVGDQVELESGDNGFQLKLKGGIGDAKELEGLIEKVRNDSPFLFEANNISGSGASGSNTTNGNGQKTMARSAFAELAPAAQMEFSKSGGALTD